LQGLIETAKAYTRSKVEHPFRVLKQQFCFQKTRLRGLTKYRCKFNVLAALTNLFLASRRLLAKIMRSGFVHPKRAIEWFNTKVQSLKPFN